MEVIKASGFVIAGNNLRTFAAPSSVFTLYPRDFKIETMLGSPETDIVIRCLRILENDCRGLGLAVSLPQVTRLLERLVTGTVSSRDLETACVGIYECLAAELDTRLFLALSSSHVPYYEHHRLGWEAVLTAFPSMAYDIEEASKSLALNRYTACVFHLMRVMEAALRQVASTLKDPRINPKTNPTWERILRRFDDEQAKPLKERAPEWQSDELWFSSVSAHLRAVKDAWRNPTMHVEINYDEERAIDIWQHVRSFTRHIATKLHE